MLAITHHIPFAYNVLVMCEPMASALLGAENAEEMPSPLELRICVDFSFAGLAQRVEDESTRGIPLLKISLPGRSNKLVMILGDLEE